MASKPWDQMSPDEKIEWLKKTVDGFLEISQHNVNARGHQMTVVMDRISAVEERVENLVRDIREGNGDS